MERYDEYKDSGINYIGNIPVSWVVRRGKTILSILSRPVREDDGVVTCFRDGEVTLRSNRRLEGFTNSEKEIGYQGVEPGDLVVHGMDGFAGSIGISDSRGKMSPIINIMDSSENKKYLMYYLRAMAYRDVFLGLSTGIRVRSCDLRWNKLAMLPFLVPNKDEQEKIVSFLDSKCSDIDSAIFDAKASIEEYKKLKQAVITQVVTKGLDSDAEMKDSGVDWIGRINKSHALLRLKYLLSESLQYGASESGVEFNASLPRYIRITDITSDGKLKEEGKLSLEEGIASPYLLKDKDLLFARSGGTVGKSFLFRKDYGKSAFAGYLIKASFINPLDAEFVYLYTQSSIYDEWKNMIFNRATIQNIGADKYSNLPVILPYSDNEKESIIKYLSEKIIQIDMLINDKQDVLEELDKYKKSLIFEVVTGKRKVV